MSIARKRRKLLAWDRYLMKIGYRVPVVPRWMDESQDQTLWPRERGGTRAWERYCRSVSPWPWRPNRYEVWKRRWI